MKEYMFMDKTYIF